MLAVCTSFTLLAQNRGGVEVHQIFIQSVVTLGHLASVKRERGVILG